MTDLPPVVLGVAGPRCLSCADSGHVCETHPDRPWFTPGGDTCCGGAGMPCPACCTPIPEDGTQPIGRAFVPDHQRPEE